MAYTAPKLTRPLIDRMVAIVKSGVLYKRDAAALCGIHRATLDRWEKRGHAAVELLDHPPERPDYATDAQHATALVEWRRRVRSEKLYAEFIVEVELARDHGAGWLVQQILEHAANPDVRNNKWTAYMTVLERSRRNEWGRGQRLEHTGDQAKPQLAGRADLSRLSSDERAELRGLLQKISAVDDG